VFLFSLAIHAAEDLRITLRSSARHFSLAQVLTMPYISIREKKNWGFYGHGTINHSYEKRYINGDSMVLDHATGLIWHQSGSGKYMKWSKAKKWLKDLNNMGYAGYHDWRLPTVEEASSLLEPNKKNRNLYIDPVFSNNQGYIWTGDKIDSMEAAWRVSFEDGHVYWSRIDYDHYVRPVFSLK